MATLKMLDPRASVNPKDRPLVPGLDTLEGKVIGIIDNGQSNSTTCFKSWPSCFRNDIDVKRSAVQDQTDAHAGRAQTDHGGNHQPM